MDITKYLECIDIPATNEDQLKLFLEQNEAEIKMFLLKKWDDFSVNNSASVTSVSVETKPEIVLEINDTMNLNPDIEQIDANIQTPNQLQPKMDNKANEAFELLIKNNTIILPNGKANQEYRFVFNIANLGLTNIGDYWFEGIDTIGLAYNPDTNEIKGMPTTAGDHKIKLKIKRDDWSEGKPIFEREITLIINHDPKSLWKNIPTPTDIEYYKPDSDKEFIKVEAAGGLLGMGKKQRKDMVAASQRGRSHAQEGKARDDDFGLYFEKDSEWYIVTVADGAGSAKSSRKGSQIACTTAIEVCKNQLTSQHKQFEHLIKEYNTTKTDENRKKIGDSLYSILGNAVFKAVKNIEEEAKTKNSPLKDYATTLIVSICKKFKFGWFVGAFWVGDGGIGIYNKDTRFLRVLGESDGGEYAGQTRFLTMPEITQPTELYRRLRFDIVDDFTALIAMSDGITDPKFETDANLLKIEKWNELWNDLSKEVQFTDDNEASADELLKWLDFWSPGNHDDRTIAILF